MPVCWSKFISKVINFLNINQLIANDRTAAVVKKSPTAAVAVNSEMFIFGTIL